MQTDRPQTGGPGEGRGVRHVEVPEVSFVSVLCWDAGFREQFDALECLQKQTIPKEKYEIVFVEYYEEVNARVRNLARECPNMHVAAIGNPHPGRGNCTWEPT